MPNIEVLEIIRILVFLFSVIGISYSVQSLRLRLQDIRLEDLPKLTPEQRVVARRSVSREVERIGKFLFFIVAAGANLGRDYIDDALVRDGLALTVLIALLVVNFLMMLATLRDKQEAEEIANIIKRRKERERANARQHPERTE